MPVDPADVRKVMLEEPPGNSTSERGVVRKARDGRVDPFEPDNFKYESTSREIVS